MGPVVGRRDERRNSRLASYRPSRLNALVNVKPGRHSNSPPHNPGVRELVQNKRKFSSPPNREHAELGFQGWHERGYLPHRDEPGLTQLVTFRLADSFPRALRSEWAALLEIEDEPERRAQLERYLDSGKGECLLRRPDLGNLVDESLRFYHDRRCHMLAWVVMPNHVHALFRVGQTPLSVLVRDWKRYTGREANKLLKRHGQFWADDYWDTYMRNEEHTLKSRRYVENNPVKAFLVGEPAQWPWSSARFRDKHGVLHF